MMGQEKGRSYDVRRADFLSDLNARLGVTPEEAASIVPEKPSRKDQAAMHHRNQVRMPPTPHPRGRRNV